MSIIRRTAGITAALALSLGTQEARAADIDVVLAVPTQSLTYGTQWITEDAGLYKKEGLSVTTRSLTGVASNNALINGSAQFILGTAGTALIGASKGQRMLMLANMVDKPSSEIVLRKDVAAAAGITADTPLADRIKALKGKTLGIAGFGSVNHAWVKLVAGKGKLSSETDMTLAVVDASAMVAAMEAKRIDGFSNTPPFSTEAELKDGAVVIASASKGDAPEYLPIAQTVLMAKPETCQKNHDMCARMVRAYQDAVNFIREKPDEAWQIIRKHNDQMDEAVLKGAWDATVAITAADMRVTQQSLENAQKFSLDAGLLQPAETITDFNGLYTDEFLK